MDHRRRETLWAFSSQPAFAVYCKECDNMLPPDPTLEDSGYHRKDCSIRLVVKQTEK